MKEIVNDTIKFKKSSRKNVTRTNVILVVFLISIDFVLVYHIFHMNNV